MKQHTDFDVAIVGGGPVGLALAAWLAAKWGNQAHRIAVFDAKPLSVAAQDPRILALSEATRLRLSNLGFPAQATPIHHIHVSEQNCFGQVRMNASDMALPALGWTMRYGELVHTLSDVLQQRGVQVHRAVGVKPAPLTQQPAHGLELADGRQYTTHLRVDAEGGVYGDSNPRDHQVDFQQSALVSEVTAQVERRMLQGQNTLAFERFTPQGPLALLPISTDQCRYALVWCASPHDVKRRLDAPNAEFLAELNAQLGRRVCVLTTSARHAFPVGMSWRSSLVQGTQVAIGNAAQILHPVAGQGLNLGLRDALQLSRSVSPQGIEHAQGLACALQQFDKGRAVDRAALVHMTQWMVKGFSNPNPLLAFGRQTALHCLEYAPPLRKQFAELMLYGLMS